MSETEVTTESQVDDTENLDTFADDFFGQKKSVPEPKTKSEVAQEEVEPKVGDTDAQEDVDPNNDPDAGYKEAPPKKKTVQDRIDEVVKQREDVKRELDALRREFEESRKPAVQAPSTKEEPQPTDTNADGTLKYELGEFDPQYIRDLTRHTLEEERVKVGQKVEAEHQARQQQEATQALQATWNGKVETATQEYPDFVEKGQTLLNGFNNLDTNYAAYLSSVLMSMDKGPEVLYYLSNNPQEATQIVNSGAQKATLALGRIEAKFLDADAQKQLAKPKVSKAPPPPTERARGTNGAFVAVAPDTDDLDDFSEAFFAKKK